MDRLVGRTLGRYRLDALSGRGGMAAVFRATDPAFGRTVAVKVLNPRLADEPHAKERFLREARSVAGLQHPHILPVHDVGEQDGLAYLVMPYIEGGTFKELLSPERRARAGGMPVAEAVALLRPIALALDYAHRRGILHRDVKPTNILLAEGNYPLLADFGIAKALEQEAGAALTATGTMVGTAEYMSPEQAQGQSLDGRSDLYALGVVAYEALTGRPPFRGDTPGETPVAILVRHLTAPPPPPRSIDPAISPAVEEVLLRALAKRPDERYPTGAAFFEALAAASDASPTVAAAAAGAAAAPQLVGAPGAPPPGPTGPPTGQTPAPGPVAAPPGATPPAGASAGGASPAERPRPRMALLVGIPVALLLLLGLVGAAAVLALRTGGGQSATPSPIIAASPPAGTTVPAGANPPATAAPSPTAPTAAPTATPPGATATVPVPTAILGTAAPPASTAGTPRPVAGTGSKREVILFSAHRGDVHDSQIFAMDPDGGNSRQLTISRGHSWGPKIAPDGKTFVFSSVAPEEHVDHSARGGGKVGSGNHDIYLANGDGSDIVKLTRERSWDNAWSWSPDGARIAFASDRDGNWELYTMTAKGEQVARLTNHEAQDGWPVWTPDGKQIVFASDRDGGYSQIYIMDVDGSNPRRLHLSEAHDTLPAISPDGKRIAYASQNLTGTEGEIYLMDLDGSNPRRLTSTIALNTEPVWSPDGAKIAFVSDRGGNSDIYVMNADGSGVRRLTNDPGEDVTPHWGLLEIGQAAAGARAASRVPLPAAALPDRARVQDRRRYTAESGGRAVG